VVVLGYLFIKMPSVTPDLIIDVNGLTTISLITTSFISALYVYAFIRSLNVYIKTGDVVYKTLSTAFMLMFFSEITVLAINRINDHKSLLSQLFMTVSYIFMFYAFYIQNIRRPYLLLTKAKEELDGYLTELDNLVDQRTNELRSINEKLLADQEIARGIQLSMLPAEMPRNEYVAFSSGYIPADNLSGDFYNVFRIDDYQYGVCIGDVSGHGVSAAMLSIFTFQKMQSLMEETGAQGMSIPSMVLKHIYESFNAANFNDDMYIVMLYGVFNTQSGIFSYASGGLNTTPLRLRPDGSIQELDNDGFAICKLGSLLKPKFVNHQVLLFPGDKLIIYTDGLTDARNSEGEKYSISRLKKIIQKYSKWGAEQITSALMHDVKKFAGEKPADDITFVILDVLPPF
jgi:sigma-B regulation protein RsbU (phosphoserine phosphatase)